MNLELAWFAALCDDDYRQLGVVDRDLRSSYRHCRAIVLEAERQGFDNILLPSGYELGIDGVAFAAAVAPELERLRLLVAVRCAELWPPQLARQLATLDQILDGRLTINIISSDLPGAPVDSAPRYARSTEVMQILRALLDGESIAHHGDFFDLELDPPRICRERTEGCPPFYFGGISEPARNTAAAEADVFLLWPDTLAGCREVIDDMRRRAEGHGRDLRFGFRTHLVVRDTEDEARSAAAHLISAVDEAAGKEIARRSLDSGSAGVRRQAELRESAADDGFAEGCLWTGIGKARSGAGAALVGTPEQVSESIALYAELGIESFIFSGYPHLDECTRVGETLLPLLR